MKFAPAVDRPLEDHCYRIAGWMYSRKHCPLIRLVILALHSTVQPFDVLSTSQIESSLIRTWGLTESPLIQAVLQLSSFRGAGQAGPVFSLDSAFCVAFELQGDHVEASIY